MQYRKRVSKAHVTLVAFRAPEDDEAALDAVADALQRAAKAAQQGEGKEGSEHSLPCFLILEMYIYIPGISIAESFCQF